MRKPVQLMYSKINWLVVETSFICLSGHGSIAGGFSHYGALSFELLVRVTSTCCNERRQKNTRRRLELGLIFPQLNHSDQLVSLSAVTDPLMLWSSGIQPVCDGECRNHFFATVTCTERSRRGNNVNQRHVNSRTTCQPIEVKQRGEHQKNGWVRLGHTEQRSRPYAVPRSFWNCGIPESSFWWGSSKSSWNLWSMPTDPQPFIADTRRQYLHLNRYFKFDSRFSGPRTCTRTYLSTQQTL